MSKVEDTAQEAVDFLNEYAGMGTEGMSQKSMATSYLTIAQDLSECVKDGICQPGEFFNSGNMHSYGNKVKVIPVAFKEVWDERNVSGMTEARHEPNSIKVIEQPAPPGSKSRYPRLINPETGNQILETFAYALVLVDEPEAGFVVMTAGTGSMKTFRRWNTMRSQILTPAGETAPIFAKIWELSTEQRISKTTNKPYYALASVVDKGWIKKEMVTAFILPAVKGANVQLIAAPTVVDESVESTEE